MHEVSVCHDMMALIEDHLATEGTHGPVKVVRLRIGAMSGVVPEALSFAFECVSPGTRFAGAKLEIENVPLVVRCESCDAESRLDEPFFFCPKCGGFSLTVVSGDEMNVASVDVDDGEVL